MPFLAVLACVCALVCVGVGGCGLFFCGLGVCLCLRAGVCGCGWVSGLLWLGFVLRLVVFGRVLLLLLLLWWWCVVDGFFLESLILAQDERWRRA